MKDTEIYNIFNTEKILNRPAEVAISNASGAAGIAYWINNHYDGVDVKKQDAEVASIKKEIDELYADGRTTLMGDEELISIIERHYPALRGKAK
jgi:isopropylmalate/homocitrate/citramalate synthase